MTSSAERSRERKGMPGGDGADPEAAAGRKEPAVTPAATAWRKTASEQTPGASLIAIVDDDALVAQTIGSLVESLGHRVVVFNAAGPFLSSEAVKTAACLITDLQMPGLGGLQLQKELRSRGYRRPVIVVSGHSDEESRARALSAGAVGFLRKPFDTQALIDCLEAAITPGAARP